MNRMVRLQVLGLVEVKHHMTWHYYGTRIVPVGLFMALTLYCGNVVYLYLSVAFIQMLKVCTPFELQTHCKHLA